LPPPPQTVPHKFSLGGHEGYITAGMYDDGTVGEIFLTDIGKEGSTLRGMMNAFATAISIALPSLHRCRRPGDRAAVVQAADLGVAETEQVGEDLIGVLSENRRAAHRDTFHAVEPQW
jgi:hypothetical protein